MTPRPGLVGGGTGISGGNVAARLLADGWSVAGLCRRPEGLDERITPIVADLLDRGAVAAAVEGAAPTHTVFTTWQRRATVVPRRLRTVMSTAACSRTFWTQHRRRDPWSTSPSRPV